MLIATVRDKALVMETRCQMWQVVSSPTGSSPEEAFNLHSKWAGKSACSLPVFLLGFLFDLENGGNNFLRYSSVNFYQDIRRYIPEDIILGSQRRKNHKSHKKNLILCKTLAVDKPPWNEGINKKFWKELIACYPLIWHGPHRKRHVQRLFYCCMRICFSDNVFIEPLLSNYTGINLQTHRQHGDLITLHLFLQSKESGLKREC
jgi:hypothetical protein